MKKRLLITIAIALIGLVSVVFAAEPVPPAPPPTAKEVASAVKKEMGDIPGALKKVNNTMRREVKALDCVVNVWSSSTQVLGTLNSNVGNMSGKLDCTAENIMNIGKQVDNSSYRTIGFMAAIGVLLLLAIGGAAWYTSCQIGLVKQAVDEMPDKAADAVLSPWDFDIADHLVTWRPASLTNIQEIHVPRGKSGDPANFVRNIESREGVARRNFRKTMRLYYEGKFDAPEYSLQKALIEYLIDKGEVRAPKLEAA